MNSRGIQASGGFGLEMANLIKDGTATTDMFSYDIARFQNSFIRKQIWLDQGTQESQVWGILNYYKAILYILNL